jgi:hypothetical protein
MKKHFQLPLLVALTLCSFFSLSAQCPGCTINLPPLSEDTIWLSSIPDGEAGIYYAEDMSFRLPKTTTPVNANDPSTPAGLTISEITITSLVNLPPGIQWEASQTVFDTSDETDGCIRLCGIPQVADTFNIQVKIDAVIFGLTQNTSFSVSMVINPAVSNTDGFSMTNNIGCGSSTVEFSNNINSNGAAGFIYAWDFGNGTTSTEENPSPVLYDEPGEYVVSYEATVDTSGYFLSAVTVVDASCDDIFGNAPDMSITVNNPNGTNLFTTADYENTFPPITHNGFYELTDGEYYMEVIDDDISGDDVCGIITFDKFSNGLITIGDLTVELTILHLTTTVTSTDTVTIFEQPSAPVITGSVPSFIICAGETMTISSSYATNNQWYQDGLPITGATENNLEVLDAGSYYVEYTSLDGCVATSEEIELVFTAAPDLPAYVNDNNLLTLFDLNDLPAAYELQWYQDGNILVGENDIEYCIEVTGEYTLVLTDLVTGCSNSFTQTAPYNPNVSCLTNADDLLADYDIKLSPNPTTGRMELSLFAHSDGQLNLRIVNMNGQQIYSAGEHFGTGAYQKTIDITGVAAGMYMVTIALDNALWTERIIVY